MPAQTIEPRPLRILLVEDNADDAALLERHLRRSGFKPDVNRVETAEEFHRGLAALPGPEVVLADYNLPSFSGPEALQLLRSSGLDIPFIMMSGAMSEETAVASMRAGAQDYVIKQNLARLVPAVERELREAATRSSRRAAEAALRASEVRFHRLVDAMPIGLLLAGRTQITYSNQAAAILLGRTTQALLSGGIYLDDLGIEVERVLDEPREITIVRSDGTCAELLVATTYLNLEQTAEDLEIAVFLVDLSKQKLGEELLRRTEKLAVAGRLAASIAHEINNPLAAVTNCLFLVSNTELTFEGRNYLETAQKELDRVAQITVQTLRFHRQSSRPVHSDLHDLAETVLALFEPRLRRQEITVHRDFASVRPLLCYEGEIRQVIVNLLGNALDACTSCGGSITLRTRRTRMAGREGEGIALTVADCGTGIAPEALARLFEPFFSTKGITGTGLGLWVSQEIVARHSGTIRVRSRLRTATHAGSTVFRICLPLDGIPTPASGLDSVLPN